MIRPVSPPARKRVPTHSVPEGGGAADVPALAAVEQELIAIFADLSVALGLPRSLGQIYGLAFASPEPVCFDDVVSRLGLSKGSASQGLRVLRELGALREAQGLAKGQEASGKGTTETRRPVDGETAPSGAPPTPLPLAAYPLPPSASAVRQYFVPETSVRALLGALIRQRVQPPLASGAERLARLRAALRSVRSDRPTVPPSDRAAKRPPSDRTAHLAHRIHSLETWHRKAKLFLPLLLKLAG
jgi:hypothetical protein